MTATWYEALPQVMHSPAEPGNEKTWYEALPQVMHSPAEPGNEKKVPLPELAGRG